MITDFEEICKTKSNDELADMYATAALVDWWKATIICQEQDRRRKVEQCNSTQNNKLA